MASKYESKDSKEEQVSQEPTSAPSSNNPGKGAESNNAQTFDGLKHVGGRSLAAYNPYLDTTSSVNWLRPTGSRIDFAEGMNESAFEAGALDAMHHAHLPGIMQLEFNPCPGISLNSESGINKGTQEVYNVIRQRISSNRRYTNSELGIHLGATDSVIMMFRMAERALGFYMENRTVNLYRNEYLFDTMHLDWKTWSGAIDDVRTTLGLWAVALNKLVIPSSIFYYARHLELVDTVYTDNVDAMSQFYVYVPGVLYRLEEATGDLGGRRLKAIEFGPSYRTAPWTWPHFKTLMNNMLASIDGSEDYANIQSDLAAVYGASDAYKFGIRDFSFRLTPTWDPDMLVEIQNAVVLPPPSVADGNLDITQTTNINQCALIYNPMFPATDLRGYDATKVIQLPFLGANNIDMAVAARLVPSIEHQEDDGSMHLSSCGSEYLVGMRLFHFTYLDGVMFEEHPTCYRFSTVIDTTLQQGSYLNNVFSYLSDLYTFTVFPMVHIYVKDSQGKMSYGGTLAPMRHYAQIINSKLDTIHLTQMYAYWGVNPN